MLPHSFPEANAVFTKPHGWSDEMCSDLHVCSAKSADGEPLKISFWKPSYEDLQALNNGGGIYLILVCGGQPPVVLQTESPF